MAQIIDGRALANALVDDIAQKTAVHCRSYSPPCLAIICVGDGPASKVYINAKITALKKAGMQHQCYCLDSCVTEADLVALIRRLNTDDCVDAVLLQLPLPPSFDAVRIMQTIDRYKDVDGFTAANVGSLALGDPVFVPCTAQGIVYALRSIGCAIAGKHAVIVGRSSVVGKPLAALLTNADATVTLCHSKTEHLASHTRHADILVAAVGKARFITADMVKKGAVVIDVGINRVADPTRPSGSRLTGDVDFEVVQAIAGCITPVPGGVGPLTVAMLLQNTLLAAQRRHGHLHECVR
ncbi:MAG: bifunctional 5,10-methylenetetrahydrofolate dehydrogenase/5,10-methenyltetrahydrofolate cyclohydrolase [Treponema sp.]